MDQCFATGKGRPAENLCHMLRSLLSAAVWQPGSFMLIAMPCTAFLLCRIPAPHLVCLLLMPPTTADGSTRPLTSRECAGEPGIELKSPATSIGMSALHTKQHAIPSVLLLAWG